MVEPALRKRAEPMMYGAAAGLLLVVAFAVHCTIYIDKRDLATPFMIVTVFGALPGILLGRGLTTVGLSMRDTSLVHRLLVLAVAAVGIAFALCSLVLPFELSVRVCLPAFVMAFAIERRTQSGTVAFDEVVTFDLRPRLSPATLGGILGVVNDAVCSLGFGFHEGSRHPFESAREVAAFCFIPAIVTGVVLGVVAGAARKVAVPFRFVILGVPPLLVVAGLSMLDGGREMFLLSSIPTLVGVIVLERGTREQTLVPAAIAR